MLAHKSGLLPSGRRGSRQGCEIVTRSEEFLRVLVVDRGEPGSPGSDGASPYLRR